MPDRCLNRRELAEKLGRSVIWTYRHLDALPGFPSVVLPHAWSEAAVDRWLAARSEGGPGSPPAGGPAAAGGIDWDTILDGNAERMTGA